MYLKMMGRGLLLRNIAVLVLFVDSKIFEIFTKNRLINHINICGLFPIFLYGFRFSRSTADLLPYVSNGFGATQPMTLDIAMTFHRVWMLDCMLDLFANSSLMKF